MSRDFYYTSELAKLAAISESKLIAYVQRGYVKPSVQEAAGHGSRRLWSALDAVRCHAIRRLLSFFSVETMRELAPYLAKDEWVSPGVVWNIARKGPEESLVVSVYSHDREGNVSWLQGSEPVSKNSSGELTVADLLRHQDIFVTLGFSALHDEVDQAIHYVLGD